MCEIGSVDDMTERHVLCCWWRLLRIPYLVLQCVRDQDSFVVVQTHLILVSSFSTPLLTQTFHARVYHDGYMQPTAKIYLHVAARDLSVCLSVMLFMWLSFLAWYIEIFSRSHLFNNSVQV